VIVDGMDGEVARLKLKESTFGHYLDIITDNIVHIAIFIGMGYGLYKRTDDQTYLYLIGVLLIGFGLCAISVYQCILKKDEKELRKSPFLIRLMSFLTNRDFAYLVAFLAIIDRLNWFFIMTAIGSYIFSALLWILSYWYKKNYPADSAA
jgi:phosphatidylglycerophosphate synthase